MGFGVTGSENAWAGFMGPAEMECVDRYGIYIFGDSSGGDPFPRPRELLERERTDKK